MDQNPLSITFTADKTSVAEDDADKTVTFQASIPFTLTHELVLVVSTTALTRVSADADADDVMIIPSELTIAAGETAATSMITVDGRFCS